MPAVPDLGSGPSATARAWNGHPSFRSREKASGWVRTGPHSGLPNHVTVTVSSGQLDEASVRRPEHPLFDTLPPFGSLGAAVAMQRLLSFESEL